MPAGFIGTPNYASGSFGSIIDSVKKETEMYLEAGVDSILIENMHDLPYLNRTVGPEITAAMTLASYVMKSMATNIPCGIQILAGCNKEAMAVAKASNLDFIRAEGFVFSHVADEGLMNSDAGELLRYRKMIDAENVAIFTDIRKKHSSHAITNDLGITDVAKAAEFFLSDGLILTGSSTGAAASADELEIVLKSCDLPLIIGSGVTAENCHHYKHAHGFIIGSHFKEGGNWKNLLSLEKIKTFMSVVNNDRW